MSFNACADPTGPPTGITALAQVSNNGRHLSTTSAGPPTNVVSSPDQACAGVRDSGASISVIPFPASSTASRSVTCGSDVEQSMTVSPFRATGTSAASVASTSGEPVTQRTIASASAAIAPRSVTSTAPRPTRSSTASRFRCAITRSGYPFSTAFFAIPQPMSPTPTKPITGFSAISASRFPPTDLPQPAVGGKPCAPAAAGR